MYGTDTQVKEELVSRILEEREGKLCIYRNGQPIKTRTYNVISGFGLDHNLGVYNNGVDAIARALTERYFFCEDKQRGGFRKAFVPVHGAYKSSHFKNFREGVMSHMPILPRLSRQQVVDRYTGSKKRVYTAAMHSLGREALTDRDAHLKMFVKFEKQDLTKAPRGINPRDPRFNLELGRYLKHAEKHVFKAINKTFGSVAKHTVIKGLNAEASGTEIRKKWDRFRKPVALPLDAEKFDMHVSVDGLKYEHTFYIAMFPGMKQLVKLLSKQLKNVGIAYAGDGVVKFSIYGTRSSGDLNTSLGNCIIMCGCIYAYAAQRGVTVELANNGDDCVVIMESEDLDRFQTGLDAWFKDHGFSMVSETPVYIFEQIEFCQTKPVCVNGAWRMVRNQNAVMKKDPICMIPIQNNRVYRKWLDAVGTCGSILNTGVPVQQSFYGCYKRFGVKCSQEMIDHINKDTSMQTRIRGMAMGWAAVAPSTRVSYYYAFGVLPDEQVAIEDAFERAQIGEWEGKPIMRDHLDLEPGIKLLQNEIPW